MRIGIVGNNDGPLVLLRSLAERDMAAEWVGLQKPVPPLVLIKYRQLADDLSEKIDEAWVLDKLAQQPVDVLVNCFCNFKFKETLNQVPILNVHLSYLPKYRGRHPLHWALINGETEHGVTIHRMAEKMDAGEIYWQEKVAVRRGSSVRQLREDLLEKLEDHFGDFMVQWQQGQVTSKPNRDEEATWFRARAPKDSRLTEWNDRDRMYRKVMALRTEKEFQAYLLVDGQPVHVNAAAIPPHHLSNMENRLVSIEPDEIIIRCDDGQLLLLHFADVRHPLLTSNSEIT